MDEARTDTALRAGVAIYNAGAFHAAHDAWEESWLALEDGSDDERLLHGLIQFTAAIHHATAGNNEGATGLAASAQEYLEGIGRHRGVNVREVRAFLAQLEADPETVEIGVEAGIGTEDETEAEVEAGTENTVCPPALTVDGTALSLETVSFEVGAMAAVVLAGEYGYDERVIERAVAFARRDLKRGQETSPLVTLVLDFARDGEHRAIVADRLGAHVDRRAARESDVNGLFESGHRREDEDDRD